MAYADTYRRLLQTLFNHIVLPPRLPQLQDEDLAAVTSALNRHLLVAIRQLRDKAPDSFHDVLNTLARALSATESLHIDGFIDKNALVNAYRKLEVGDFAILYITEQNAGLILRKCESNVSVDAFEASPPSAEVLAAGRAMQWTFPGSSISVSNQIFDDDRFLDNLAHFLDRASHETVHQFVATTAKAGRDIVEYRDTPTPSLVTSMFMTLLEVNGRHQPAHTVSKRIRDDVSFGARGNPWRRSPFWLVLRVAIQQALQIMLGQTLGRATYKTVIAMVIHQLCEHLLQCEQLPLECVAMARTKLAYRMSKLTPEEFNFDQGSPQITTLNRLLHVIREPCKLIIHNVNATIDTSWSNFKKRMKRPINILPEQAFHSDLVLTLKCSYQYLQEALAWRAPEQPLVVSERPSSSSIKGTCGTTMNAYVTLTERETNIHLYMTGDSDLTYDTCTATLMSYQRLLGNMYEGFVEGTSTMLLIIMELWVALDRLAVDDYPLLIDHRLPFDEGMLTVLHLNSYEDMQRLHNVEAYLVSRRRKCHMQLPTIFAKPSNQCFAARYFDTSRELQRLQSAIIEKSIADAQIKREELQQMTEEYNEIAERRGKMLCKNMPDPVHTGLRVHDNAHCGRCYLGRKLGRFSIDVYEYPLPEDPSQQKAICFELDCPRSFATYREITWRLVRDWSPRAPGQAAPAIRLFEHDTLKEKATCRENEVTLASRAKPIFATHYGKRKLPLAKAEVCVPCSAIMELYDRTAQLWTADNKKSPSFARLCAQSLPINSPMSSLQFDPDFAVDRAGPTPNAVLANQTKCPQNANISEFLAFQDLHSGQSLLWPRLLRELGCSNLNFSSPTTTMLVSRIVLQAGSAQTNDILRQRHWVFDNPSFCRKLLEQISARVLTVANNWRESQCLESMLTILLRLLALTKNEEILRLGYGVLSTIREITSSWVRALRIEVHSASDAAVFERRRKDIVWACLLARRTMNAESLVYDANLASDLVRIWVEISIVLCQNLEESLEAMTAAVRHALIRDWRRFASLKPSLKQALLRNPQALSQGIYSVWKNAGMDDSQSIGEWKRHSSDDEWFSSFTRPSSEARAQRIDYNFVRGFLFIDGQLLGKLPEEHRAALVLRELFGDQPLYIWRSYRLGMTYMLATTVESHEVHFGFRNNVLVVRAVHRPTQTLYEHVPVATFGTREKSDLPGPLIDGCVHWLNIRSGSLEIRQRTEMWKYKENNWTLDVHTRQMRRGRHALVDPYSALFQRATFNLSDFEPPDRMLLYQQVEENHPRLTLQLSRLDLRFHVNSRGLLQSRELHAEVDPNQDAGTWYGLRSKLVIRNHTTRRLRSVIIPLGVPVINKHGVHVTISIAPSGEYGRFTIDPLLQRLDCAAEPALMYLRVLYHALTSFIIPDELTGKTGTEEALRYLHSASTQPWTTITEGQRTILEAISRISPLREYYPPGKKSMQCVTWDDNLTTIIQNDQYRSLVNSITSRSEAINLFMVQTRQTSSAALSADEWLISRAVTKSFPYANREGLDDSLIHCPDLPYQPRDGLVESSGRDFVAEVTTYLRDWSSKMRLPRTLNVVFQQWPSFRGFIGAHDIQTLSDLLSTNLPEQWALIAEWCRSTTRADMYELMFFFAVISFGNNCDMDIIRSLVAFALLDDLKSISPPHWPEYTDFKMDERPSPAWLMQILQPCRLPYEYEEELRNDPRLTPKEVATLQQEQKAHDVLSTKHLTAFTNFLLMTHWPDPVLVDSVPIDVPLISISKANDLVCSEWQRLAQNFHLSEYTKRANCILAAHQHDVLLQAPLHSTYSSPQPNDWQPTTRIPSLVELTRIHALSGSDLTPLPPAASAELIQPGSPSVLSLPDAKPRQTLSELIGELDEIVTLFKQSENATRQQYAQDLAHSLESFATTPQSRNEAARDVLMPELVRRIGEGYESITSYLMSFRNMLFSDTRSTWLSLANLWHSAAPNDLLKLLLRGNCTPLSTRFRKALIDLGLTITSVQRLIRIEHAARSRQVQILRSELKNLGHSNWSPLERPEWLVLEVESNIMIREKQVDVAQATISPSSDSNSVLQLNMGEGKTSCIIPMVAAVLANRQALLRVIVPKALLPQMAQILQSRLGGLLAQPVTHVPFSRRTPTTTDYVSTYRALHQQSLERAGVMLTLPEHLMSFKLSGLQRLVEGRTEEAKAMMQMQGMLDKRCRDVLDESDFTLAARTQLIYPSGAQHAVDGHPDRWRTVQAVLHLARGLLWNVREQLPDALEIDSRASNGYPSVHFLHKRAEDLLVSTLRQSLCDGHGSIISGKEHPEGISKGISTLISVPSISNARFASLETYMRRTGQVVQWKNLLLLRGLLVHRILILGMKKRWNVQYGLHPDRDPISVPYHAKGVPSETAEWGHPDVAILLTCLSFYYAGLSLAQLRQGLTYVLKSDDKGAEYEFWLSGTANVAESLRDCNSLNLDDDLQVVELWHCFRYSTVVIDYYLNNFVFPQHAKQFEQKLQASGWDIPLKRFSRQAQDPSTDKPIWLSKNSPNGNKEGINAGITTGFSGTNDSRSMLPLTIRQNDLGSLRGTNAEVLTYLLESRNSGYVLAAKNGRRFSELDLLDLLFQQDIRIFIDAGAQILESDNLSLVQAWLKKDFRRPAAVFFNRNDKAIVYHRQGTMTPLLGSPYADDLSDCLVYLDEAHTRGTDLRLPPHAVGALTLGPGQTKDHTVQAAMRLRQLGTTQSIVWFAPPEVHQSILDFRCKAPGSSLGSKDIVAWLIEQTCKGIEQLQPLFYSQGMDFCRRSQAAVDSPDLLKDKAQRVNFLSQTQQQEDHSLSRLYSPRVKRAVINASSSFGSAELAQYVSTLFQIRKSFEDTGEAVQAVALQEVEQEREVAVEAETVRAIHKPPHRRPLIHMSLDRALVEFCIDGRPRWRHWTCQPAFTHLRSTSIGKDFGIQDHSNRPRLYVSQDFARTVELPMDSRDDAYARPVNWILWSMVEEMAVIISPHEAELLLPHLRHVKAPKTHLIVYAAPVTRKMLQFDDFNYLSVPDLPSDWTAPRWLRRDVGIFAGKLYFRFDDYHDLCQFLGVRPKIAGSSHGLPNASLDGASMDGARVDGPGDAEERGKLGDRPLEFLQQWIGVRRKGQDFAHTPMGFVVQSKELNPSHPFFAED